MYYILNYFSLSIFILEIMKSNHLMIKGANLLDWNFSEVDRHMVFFAEFLY